MRIVDFQERLQALTPQAFEDFVFQVLRAQPDFLDVQQNVVVSGIQFDIVAYTYDAHISKKRLWLIEVTHMRTIALNKLLHDYQKGMVAQRQEPTSLTQFVVVIAGALTDQARDYAQQQGLVIWDAAKLAELANPSLLQSWFKIEAGEKTVASTAASKSAALIEELQGIAPGKEAASRYQRFCADALEFLFVPPLEAPRYESSDEARRNRRDIVLENAADGGFWSFLRTQYMADYVVVDAKNYNNPIGKRPILDVAHYLKSYGCGLFAVLLTRSGASAAAEHARREQWIDARKMIAIFGDPELKSMLSVKGAGGAPEDLIRSHIAEFRLGL